MSRRLGYQILNVERKKILKTEKLKKKLKTQDKNSRFRQSLKRSLPKTRPKKSLPSINQSCLQKIIFDPAYSGCSDTIDDCYERAKENPQFCNSNSTTPPYLQHRCRKTCKRCREGKYSDEPT